MARDWLVPSACQTSFCESATGEVVLEGGLLGCQGWAGSGSLSHGWRWFLGCSTSSYFSVGLMPCKTAPALLHCGWQLRKLQKQRLHLFCPSLKLGHMGSSSTAPLPSTQHPPPSPRFLLSWSLRPHLPPPACPALLGKTQGAPGQRDYRGIRAVAGSHLVLIGWKSLLKVEKCFLPAQHPLVSADLKP